MLRYGEFLISSVVVMPSLFDSNRKTDLQIDSAWRLQIERRCRLIQGRLRPTELQSISLVIF